MNTNSNWHRQAASLGIFFALLLGFTGLAGADAQDSPKPPTREGNPRPVIYGPHEVIKDRFLRHRGHYRESKEWEWRGLEKSDRPDLGSQLNLKSTGDTLDVPAGPHFHQKAKKQQSGDQYVAMRPQYRPMEIPCGSPSGWFYPPTTPFIPNFNKDAKGQGGAVPVFSPSNLPKCYVQPLLMNPNNGNLSKEGDQALWEYELTTFGLGPISDTQYQMIERENNQRFIELMYDPERWSWMAKAAGAMQQEQAATNMAQTADHAFDTAVDTIEEYLINIANEAAAEPVRGNPTPKTKQQAIYMIQQMYHQVYIPMAILLLLPGAVLTQMKGMVQYGVLSGQDETDTKSPFNGIIRSIIAVFLIPATQLIVSYMIDVGNSLAYEVKNYVQNDIIREYAHEQMYDPKIEKTVNWMRTTVPFTTKQQAQQQQNQGFSTGNSTIDSILNFFFGGGTTADQGKAYHGKEKDAVDEKQPTLSKQIQMIFNFANYAMSTGLTVLAAFQLVFMSYLFLLGPVAAALYAWPNVSKGSPGLFNKVFGNWLDAVVLCSLWRFWWMVILATMCTYIKWSQDMGFFDPTNQWEMMVFTSFEVLLLYIPANPFDFSQQATAKMVEKVEEKARSGAGGGGGGGSGGGGGQQGGQTGGGQAPAGGTTQAQVASATMGSSSSSGGGGGGGDEDKKSGNQNEGPRIPMTGAPQNDGQGQGQSQSPQKAAMPQVVAPPPQVKPNVNIQSSPPPSQPDKDKDKK